MKTLQPMALRLQNQVRLINYLEIVSQLNKHLSDKSVAPPQRCFPIASNSLFPPLLLCKPSTLSTRFDK